METKCPYCGSTWLRPKTIEVSKKVGNVYGMMRLPFLVCRDCKESFITEEAKEIIFKTTGKTIEEMKSEEE